MKTLLRFSPVVALALFFIASAGTLNAQTVLDGVYIKENTKTKRVVPYPYIREADVMWASRIWQVIDLREKVNFPLYYPLEESNGMKSLFDVIKDALLQEGSLTAYSTGVTGQEDDFRTPLLVNEVRDLLVSQDTISTIDPGTGEMVQMIQKSEINSIDVTRYKIKEDWFFDKQRSERYIRIIGIAPQREKRTETGEATGAYETLFWLYFPECRYVFANYDAFNRFNDAERHSYDDLFWKREFNSYVIKQSNVFNRDIITIYQGMEALRKSAEIKDQLFVLEHDLWSF